MTARKDRTPARYAAPKSQGAARTVRPSPKPGRSPGSQDAPSPNRAASAAKPSWSGQTAHIREDPSRYEDPPTSARPPLLTKTRQREQNPRSLRQPPRLPLAHGARAERTKIQGVENLIRQERARVRLWGRPRSAGASGPFAWDIPPRAGMTRVGASKGASTNARSAKA